MRPKRSAKTGKSEDAETIAGKVANGYILFEWQIETQSVEQKRN
jgi:hypothetical protein